MSYLKILQEEIAVSLYLSPCTELELSERDFLRTTSFYGIQRMIQQLENDGAIYYRKEVLYIYKKWAKKNLKDKGYELDFRTEKEKYLDGLTDFSRIVLGL